MEKVKIMMERIHSQVGALPRLKANGTLRVTAEPVPGPPAADPRTLEQQVWGVADYVSEMIQQDLGTKQHSTEKEKQKHAD
jgi:hypothetical protein